MEKLSKQKHVLLTHENMSKSLIGMEVTIGIRSEEGSRSGVIKSYDESSISVAVSGKTQKMEYDPKNVILKVYQFEKGIKFCSQHELNALEEGSEPEKETPKQKPKPKISARDQIIF